MTDSTMAMGGEKSQCNASDATNANSNSLHPSASSTTWTDEIEGERLEQSPGYTSEDENSVELGESSMLRQTSVQFQAQSPPDEALSPPSYDHAQASRAQERASPKLCILFQVVTSREDIGAYISIAYELVQSGHDVRVVTFEESWALVENHGIEFFDIGGHSNELMHYILNLSSPNHVSRRQRALENMMERSWQSCFKSGSRRDLTVTKQERCAEQPFVADVIIASPLAAAHVHCAEKLGVPLLIVSTIPFTPTNAFAHPLATSGVPGHSSYALFDASLAARLHSVVNKFRQRTLNLGPLDPTDGLGKLDRLQIPTIYCWSNSLIPKPKDWSQNIVIAGLCPLPSIGAQAPPAALEEFIQNGKQPIYIHLRSIPAKKRGLVFDKLIEAVRSVGVRAVIRFDPSDVDHPATSGEDFVLVEDYPLDRILAHVSCVVHDGSSSISAAALLAGKPAVVIPFSGDQAFWSKMIQKVGAGPASLSQRHIKRRSIVRALEIAMSQHCLENTVKIANRLQAENGPHAAKEIILATALANVQACSLEPSRVAVWRFVQNGRECAVSAFAAAALVEKHFVKRSCLERIINAEFLPSSGPADPITGGTLAVTQLLYNAMKGCGDILGEFGSSALTVDRLGNRTTSRSGRMSPEVQSSISEKSQDQSNYVIGSRFLKGSGTIVKASLRSPMTFSLALAQGSHNVPRLWNDTTVREQHAVTGISSGIAAGCKEFVLGTYDGISGLVTQPCIGAKENGMIGAVQGFGKGLAGLPFKFLSAASAPVGYPLKGLDVAFSKSRQAETGDVIDVTRVKQGEHEYTEATLAQQQHIIQRWIAWQQGARFE